MPIPFEPPTTPADLLVETIEKETALIHKDLAKTLNIKAGVISRKALQDAIVELFFPKSIRAAYLVPSYGKYDCRHYVESENVPFLVVPGNVRMSIPPKFMVCKSVITDKKTGAFIECVCADVGPSTHMGEASIAAVEFFGINSNPKNGGSSNRKRWHYRTWPGVPASGFKLQ